MPLAGNRLGCNDYRRFAAGVYGKNVREKVTDQEAKVAQGAGGRKMRHFVRMRTVSP